MVTFIIGVIMLISVLAIVAVTVDGIEKKLQYQIDKLKTENKQLKSRVFDLEMRK